MEKLEKRLRARDFAPVRAALLLLGLLIALSVQLLRQSEGAMLWIYSHISRPYHAFMSRLCSHFSFSAAEVFYAVLIIGLLNNGMDMLNIQSYIQDIVQGVIIVAAVLIDVNTNRESR